MNFEIGQIVNHTIFGEGTVVEITERTTSLGARDASIVSVDFSGTKRIFTELSLAEHIS